MTVMIDLMEKDIDRIDVNVTPAEFEKYGKEVIGNMVAEMVKVSFNHLEAFAKTSCATTDPQLKK